MDKGKNISERDQKIMVSLNWQNLDDNTQKPSLFTVF